MIRLLNVDVGGQGFGWSNDLRGGGRVLFGVGYVTRLLDVDVGGQGSGWPNDLRGEGRVLLGVGSSPRLRRRNERPVRCGT